MVKGFFLVYMDDDTVFSTPKQYYAKTTGAVSTSYNRIWNRERLKEKFGWTYSNWLKHVYQLKPFGVKALQWEVSDSSPKGSTQLSPFG